MLCRLLTFALFLSLSAPSLWADHHEEEKPPRTIAVAGEGKVKTKPDTASISAGVVTEADKAREALDKNTERMQQVMQGLLEAGISQDDLQTSQFSVSPVYSRLSRKAGAPRVDPKIVGYRVTNTATARGQARCHSNDPRRRRLRAAAPQDEPGDGDGHGGQVGTDRRRHAGDPRDGEHRAHDRVGQKPAARTALRRPRETYARVPPRKLLVFLLLCDTLGGGHSLSVIARGS